jgi:high affinity Mn2+ porin
MMPNPRPIVRRGFARRAPEARKPAAPLVGRLTGTSSAAGLAMLICLLLASAAQLRAQTGPQAASQSEDKYHLGYEAGYQAGLRAAKEKLTATGDATGVPESRPTMTPKDTAASSGLNPARLNGASQINSLWDDMVNHNADDQDSVFHHSQTSPFWLSGQVNVIAQMHPRFHAQYSGPNSFSHAEEQAVSRVVTLYTGFQFDDSTELVLDAESSGWSGLSQGLGLAGFVNLDVVRNPQLSSEPYLARIWLRKVIPLSDETVTQERNPLSLLTTLPVRRIDIHAGKMSLPDFFDRNSVTGDSHLQFMNWTVDNNGAWDYAADTRGYTYAVVIEYDDHDFAARFAEALEPTVANGTDLEWNPQDAHSEDYELEYDPHLIPGRFGALRLLGYTNYADMGDYHFAIDQFLNQKKRILTVPNIDSHVKGVTTKYGFGLNFEQQLNEQIRVFMRAGWNEGQHESWAYTEVDQTASFGWDLRGDWWHRSKDKWGVAFVANGLSRRHREYLALGGLGFLLGDGNLSYGPEEIMETYYNFPIVRGVSGAFDLQYINNPGYNRARGPVIVPGLRLHIEM